ncbi:MAG: hypothetical protein KBG48_27930 [Kofleriaceae bacterium]|nr:hypothetical protein [Kofleriaceae bacterium]MBP9171261.1 hypothetical protein [Kofleriaceae bacterium]MBP9862248.1 hypothetical protein [Kofleriaceae bacterium]
MLDALWIASAAPAVEAALARLTASGPIAVVAAPRLVRVLDGRGRAVVGFDGPSRRGPGQPLPDVPTYAAVVGAAVGDAAAWSEALAAWVAATVDGGVVVTVDRAAPVEASRRILCAGLTDLEQRTAGRWLVTSGAVARV